MAKRAEVLILNDIYNIGFSHGMKNIHSTKIIKLINHLSLLPQFGPDGYDLFIEYEDGVREGKYTQTLNLLEEGE